MSRRTSDTTYEIYTLKQQLEELKKRNNALVVQNRQLVRDVEHLKNLPIPLAGREFAKSLERSVKFRVTRAIWGSERFYLPNEEMISFARPNLRESDVKEALRIINENDASNVIHLSKEPSQRRIIIYESIRKMSHIPRRAHKMIKRKATK